MNPVLVASRDGEPPKQVTKYIHAYNKHNASFDIIDDNPVFTTIHSHFMTQYIIYHNTTHHNAASLSLPPPSPSPDPPTFKTASAKSCPTDEEGHLKT
jgi:hypothetical protein